MLTIMACVPFLLVLCCFVAGWKSWQTGLLTLLATALLAVALFHLSARHLEGTLLAALFPALTATLILFPARLLYVLEEAAGTIAHVSQMVRGAARSLVVLFLVLCLSPLLEASCGFGTGMVVSIPIYLALGIAPQNAALLGLLGESTTAFASMGNAVNLEASMTGLAGSPLGMDTALLLLPCSLLCACVALLLVEGMRSLRQWWPMAVLVAGILVGGEWLVSSLDVSLAGLLSSLLTGSVLGCVLWWSRIQTTRTTSGTQTTRMLTPLASSLSRQQWQLILVPGIFVLGGPLFMHLGIFHSLVMLLTLREGTQHLYVLEYPGIWLLLACLSVILLLFKQGQAVFVGAIVQQTSKRFFPLASTIVAFVLASALLSASGMLDAFIIIFTPFAQVYLAVAPVLGTLGGWMSGSNASSNAFFAPMQVSMATRGTALWVGAAQNAASSLGRMLAPAYLLVAANSARIREQAIALPVFWLIVVAFLSMETILALVFASLWIVVGIECLTLLAFFGLYWYLVQWQHTTRRLWAQSVGD